MTPRSYARIVYRSVREGDRRIVVRSEIDSRSDSMDLSTVHEEDARDDRKEEERNEQRVRER